MRTLLALVLALVTGAAAAQVPDKAPGSIRFATFNAALQDDEAGAVLARLRGGADAQARLVAEVIQRVRPDVLVLQEIDRDAAARSLAVFADEYLAVGQGGAVPIEYPHRVFPLSNTGAPSGVDLDGNGRVGGPNDAKGYGEHHGQYAFALLSRLPLGEARTFSALLWRDVPEGLLPAERYGPDAQAMLPLSSKTHLLVPVLIEGGPITVLAAHPTPPVFDDASDFNGRRNADEIRLLVDLLDTARSAYAVDDLGRAGGMAPGPAVVMGDLNADPGRGDARPGAIARLLEDPRVQDPVPRSGQGDVTADFRNGRMRVDYVVPTADLRVTGSGVFWPAEGDPLARLNGASDHHLVWVDVALP